LFDKYSANWKLVKSFYDYGGLNSELLKKGSLVCCPLCMKFFERSALNQQLKNALTLEHVPPEKLGGKPKILLCKICNSGTGHDVDVNLMDYLKVAPFNNRENQSTVTLQNTILKAGEFEVKGKFTFKRETENSFSYVLHADDDYRKGRQKVIESASEMQIIYKPHETPSRQLVHIALLKIAYLLSFAKFGHSFSANPNYDLIRKQILNPNDNVLPTRGVLETKTIPRHTGFHIVEQPIEIRGMLVVFDMEYNGKVIRNGVLLNPPGVKDFDYYLQLKKYEGMKKIQIESAEQFSEVDFLGDKQYAFSYLETLGQPYKLKLSRVGLDFLQTQ
jgi:hypothetical protein